MSNDTEKAMLAAARRFDLAAEKMNPAQSGITDLLIPSWVNAALALEILLKCLHLIDRGKQFGRTHDLSKIFCGLREETRDSLETAFTTLLRDRDMSDVTKIEEHSGISVPLDLPENLRQASSVFVEGRYIYEVGIGPWSFMFYPEIRRVLLDQIVGLRPDLKTLVHAPCRGSRWISNNRA